MKNIKYSVIGGQYRYHWYGDFDNLLTAKRVATKNCEYWDNWQGWHKPSIWLESDCTDEGYPIPGHLPICTWCETDKKWALTEYGKTIRD